MMNNIDIANKLAEITGKSIDNFLIKENEVVVSVLATETVASPQLEELSKQYQGSIDSGFITCNKVQMSRKDYLKHVKDMTQTAIYGDPLLYVLFRSEQQSNINFLDWMSGFTDE